jgi:hydroxymethylpyrimidine pyrophosphatase-like HAD family hydrolase
MTQSTTTTAATTPTITAPSPPYRVIALDLDGTLLNDKHQLSQTTIDGLRTLYYQHQKENGNDDSSGLHIIICTGRGISTVTRHIQALALPQIYAVCSNGATAFDCRLTKDSMDKDNKHHDDKDDDQTTRSYHGVHVKPLFTIKVPEHIARTTIQLAVQHNQVSQYYADNGNIYAHPVTETHHALTAKYKELTGSQTIYITPPPPPTTTTTSTEESSNNNNIHQDRDTKEEEETVSSSSSSSSSLSHWIETQLLAHGLPTKQLVLFESTQEEKTFHRFAKALQAPHLLSHENGQPATLVRGSMGSWFLEVLPPAVHKGTGLQRLVTDILHIPLSKVVAFGDGDNDVEFLQLAGYAVAMKNGRDVVKQVAQHVTHYTNDEDGVIRTLHELQAQGLLWQSTPATATTTSSSITTTTVP